MTLKRGADLGRAEYKHLFTEHLSNFLFTWHSKERMYIEKQKNEQVTNKYFMWRPA